MPKLQNKLAPLALVAMVGASVTAHAAVVYSNDFQTAVGPAWSFDGFGALGIDHTPLPGDGSRKFLGWNDSAPTWGLSNHTVTLSLAGLATHAGASVSFDVYFINSWDGSGPLAAGPDVFTVGVGGGQVLLSATFSNTGSAGNMQTYPNPYPAGPTVASRTGAIESNTLGYGGYGDTVYHFDFSFAHAASSLTLNFAALGLQNLSDESWGLDNVVVSTVPAPGSLALTGIGLLAALGLARRRGAALRG